MKEIKKDDWVWMPHPAHFCASRWCRFHLATRIGKWIVSTLGEYDPPRVSKEIHAEITDKEWFDKNKNYGGDKFDFEYQKRFGFDETGFGRKYETMVFKAVEAPPNEEKQCCPYRADVGVEHPDRDTWCGYNDPKEAEEGHMRICELVSKKQ